MRSLPAGIYGVGGLRRGAATAIQLNYARGLTAGAGPHKPVGVGLLSGWGCEVCYTVFGASNVSSMFYSLASNTWGYTHNPITNT